MAPVDHYGYNSWRGYFSVSPNGSPLVRTAGLVFTGTIQSTMPFSGLFWDPEFGCSAADNGPVKPYEYLMVSIPVGITFLRGLNQVSADGHASRLARRHVNYVLQATAGLCGAYNVWRCPLSHAANIADNQEVWMTTERPTLDGEVAAPWRV